MLPVKRAAQVFRFVSLLSNLNPDRPAARNLASCLLNHKPAKSHIPRRRDSFVFQTMPANHGSRNDFKLARISGREFKKEDKLRSSCNDVISTDHSGEGGFRIARHSRK